MTFILAQLCFFTTCFTSPLKALDEYDRVRHIENRFLDFSIDPTGRLNLDNKLSGRSFNLNSEVFAMLIEQEGKSVTLESREFNCEFMFFAGRGLSVK